MQKTSYQTPELRDENDSIIQEGSFGKNTALSNATNDGWIDYVMNNLEALHDTIGDSAPTLDGNGHVVEPANLAIGDEDGLRIKNNYLKLSGGTVNGTLNITQNLKMQDNQENVWGGLYVPGTTATLQYLRLYGGETPYSNGGNLQLYDSGQFTLQAKNGETAYNLVGDTDGTLKWRGNTVALAKDVLPLTGGAITNAISFTGSAAVIYRNYGENGTAGSITFRGGTTNDNGSSLILRGKDNQNGNFELRASNGENTRILQGESSGKLLWDGNRIALQKDVLPLTGGTLTGALQTNSPITSTSGYIYLNARWAGIYNTKPEYDGSLRLFGGGGDNAGARLTLFGQNNNNGGFNLRASNGDTQKNLDGKSDGTLTWGGQPIQTTSDKRKKTVFDDVPDSVLDAWGNVQWQQFKYLEDVKRKGVENCRYHTGIVAQDVKKACGEVDITEYGILCYDAENDLWTVRYEEALAMEAIYQRKRADKLEQRLSEIEQRLSALESL